MYLMLFEVTFQFRVLSRYRAGLHRVLTCAGALFCSLVLAPVDYRQTETANIDLRLLVLDTLLLILNLLLLLHDLLFLFLLLLLLLYHLPSVIYPCVLLVFEEHLKNWIVHLVLKQHDRLKYDVLGALLLLVCWYLQKVDGIFLHDP